jgi:hypothetical protein
VWKKKVLSPTFLFFFLLCIFSGCATTSKTATMLNARMYKMNFEEALQRFGAPFNCADAGRTKVCTWVYGSGGMIYAPVGNIMVGMPTNAPSAQITFTDGVMTYWRLNGNWE